MGLDPPGVMPDVSQRHVQQQAVLTNSPPALFFLSASDFDLSSNSSPVQPIKSLSLTTSPASEASAMLSACSRVSGKY